MNRVLLLSSTCFVFSMALADFLPGPSGSFSTSYFVGIDEAAFHQLVDATVAPFFARAKKFGGELVVEKLWHNPEANAAASRQGNKWLVSVWGGLARHPQVTPDAFQLAVCHELGHHFAGYPFYELGQKWPSSEGQADYFATQVCLRELWAQQIAKNAEAAAKASALISQKCDAAYVASSDRNLCKRIALASQGAANLMADYEGRAHPKFETPDPERRRYNTDKYHPNSQCRLDTYFAAALCLRNNDFSTIPGLNHPKGQESVEAELVAARFSCMESQGDRVGARPGCWFSELAPYRGFEFVREDLEEIVGNKDGYLDPGETFAYTSFVRNLSGVDATLGTVELRSPYRDLEVVSYASSIDGIQKGYIAAQNDPFVVVIPHSTTCGARTSLDVTFQNSSAVRTTRRDIFVGRTMAEAKTTGTGFDVPARGEASSSVTLDVKEKISHVNVEVTLEHQFASDVKVYLIAPGQRAAYLGTFPYSREKTQTKKFRKTFEGIDGSGSWTFAVLSSGEKGRVVSYSIEPHVVLCSPTARVPL